MQQRQPMEMLVRDLDTKSDKIRALAHAGYVRGEIASFLGISYQHVRNVLVSAGIADGASRAERQMRSASKEKPMSVPTPEEFKRGYTAFREKERRDAMYKTATFLVQHFWGNPAEIADGLGVLLLTWNNAHHRYGSFDFQLLENMITSNRALLQSFRNRDISSYTAEDDPSITALFNEMLKALRICEGKKKGAGSPVGVAKALHLLAPAYFPLWDLKIARAYGCNYSEQPASKYLIFLRKMKELRATLIEEGVTFNEPGRRALKVLDEYNYARFTKKWV
jgi:hypothetical protein